MKLIFYTLFLGILIDIIVIVIIQIVHSYTPDCLISVQFQDHLRSI